MVNHRTNKAAARDLQKYVCRHVSNLLMIPWGKDELIASREMGQSGVDVRLIGKALTLFPASIECKNVKRWSLPAAIKQAQTNQLLNTDWMLFMQRRSKTKDERIPPVVIMEAQAFFEFLDMFYNRGLRHGMDRQGVVPADRNGNH